MTDTSEANGPPGTSGEANKVLAKMLDRLMAVLVNGPSLNARPHNSRQRVDFAQLHRLADLAPEHVLEKLLGDARKVAVKARVSQPKRRQSSEDAADATSHASDTIHSSETVEPFKPKSSAAAAEAAAEKAWADQNALLNKLHTVAEDARTYEQDTGVHVLNVGFPLLSLPAGSSAGGAASRRILAPIAFIPVTLTVKRGSPRAIELACRGEGVDLVIPNAALLSWIEQQTGKAAAFSDGAEHAEPGGVTNGKAVELFSDEAGEDPWREIRELTRFVCIAMDVETPAFFAAMPSAGVPAEGKTTQDPAGKALSAAGGPRGLLNPVSDQSSTIDGGSGLTEGKHASACHPERSEGSLPSAAQETLPCAQGDGSGRQSNCQSSAEVGKDGNPAGSFSSFSGAPTAQDDAEGERQRAPDHQAAGDKPPAPPALTLTAAPRADEPGSGPAILCSAILGLFPMANQGLLRDTQAMVAGGTPSGIVQSFVRAGVSLDRPAADASAATEASTATEPSVPAARRPREFAAERLVADADPCQSRAVRLARDSAGLVVHGPPGTGKSQTITNIIGDHLARGQRVLLVCEKRTALDVVANRLRHMGLGDLIAIVHDPRRDQRELYRALRQQLDDLSTAQIDESAAGKLTKVDSDLQKLHDELSAYHAALMRIDPDTPTVDAAAEPPAQATGLDVPRRRAARLSFHDLVGQWLDTLPAADTGPRLPSATADSVANFGLADLDDRLHDIEEILHRAEAVGWAANPWREAATADLPSFLAKGTEAHRVAVNACLGPARDTDATLVAAMPAFAAIGDLERQAEARVALADILEALLEPGARKVLARWSARPFSAARAARSALTEAGPYVEVLRAGPLDAELLAAASRAPLPAPGQFAAQVTALQKYADAHASWSARLDGITRSAPGVPMPVIAWWVLAEAPAAAAARKRLDAAAPLAGRAASAPLDPELLPVYRRQPFDLPQLLRWQSALETYLQIASTWHAFFHFSRRREAAPVVQFFGLPVSAAAGSRVRDFLLAVRLRLEVRDALDAALGRKPSTELEDDDTLLTGFAQHCSALTASAGLDRQAVVASARSAGPFTNVGDFINRLVPEEHAAAAPILAANGLPANAESAARLRTFLRGLSARLALQNLHSRILVGEGQGTSDVQTSGLGGSAAPVLLTDRELDESLRIHAALLDLIIKVHSDPLLCGAPPWETPGQSTTAASAGGTRGGPHPSPPPEYPEREKEDVVAFLSAAGSPLVGESPKSPLPSFPPEYRGREKNDALDQKPAPSLGTPGEGGGGGDGASPLENDRRPARSLIDAFTIALANPAAGRELVEALRRSPARVAAIASLESFLPATRLFDPAWLAGLDAKLRGNEQAAPIFEGLADRVDSLESVVRARAGVERLPAPLRGATAALMAQSADAATSASMLRNAALEREIADRLAASPMLQEIDGRRIEAIFGRYHKLVDRKQQLVRDAIRAIWVARQKQRLLAGTGSRLNGLGAELRRRLTLRGERAMRLRRVIEYGRRTPGGDPLLDLCPIWMVSPETAAQVFPREPIFDSIVFDEASQCRLEEALPVLTRGARVVIAGDPQQLPPSRFFESAVTQSEEEDPQTDQELFETQQAEVEDLLGAALGLDIRQCYLDVHYRSRSEELIAFSNEYFYHNRLQSIPRHPSRKPAFAPVTLYRVDGVYDKRCNDAEADRVCEIVQELLSVRRGQEAPSIGIACFNLPQRDLIVQRLDEVASEDPAFAKKLDEARKRTGAGSFEGLFVKNLENVQGDERDHIIISTTYGPDKSGRFYRRFGPVGLVGGGRRLNVLVTRARDRVHLVTSIPAAAYRNLPPPQSGQTPGGGWLLFAYLRYADRLASGADPGESSKDLLSPLAASRPSERTPLSDENPIARPAVGIPRDTTMTLNPGGPVLVPSPGNAEDDRVGTDFALGKDPRPNPPPEYREREQEDESQREGVIPQSAASHENPSKPAADSEPGALAETGPSKTRPRIGPTRARSIFAEALARRLASARNIPSDVYWGNDGFCVDLLLRDPAGGESTAAAVLCDAARYPAAEDPMEWDIFRSAVLESQGWRMHRLWSPHVFRDPAGAIAALSQLARIDHHGEIFNK